MAEKNIVVTRGIPLTTEVTLSPGFGGGNGHAPLRFELRSNAVQSIWLGPDSPIQEASKALSRRTEEQIRNLPQSLQEEINTKLAGNTNPSADATANAVRSVLHEKELILANRIRVIDNTKGFDYLLLALDIRLNDAAATQLRTRLAEAEAHAAAVRLEAEARRRAEEQAAAEAARRLAEEQAAAEAARRLAEEQAAAEAARRLAEEQAAAEAARRLAEEQATAEAARRLAEEQATAEAARRLAEEQAAAETARRLAEEEQRRQAELQTRNIWQHRIPAASTSAPLVINMGGFATVAEGASTALSTAIRTAGVALAEFAAATASGLAVGVAALLYSPKLGNGEHKQWPTVYTTPLALLAPELATQLAAAASHDESKSLNLPVRMTTSEALPGAEDTSTLVVARTGETYPATVKVVQATHDPATNTYSAQTSDQPPRILTWTPAVPPEDSSTTLPPESSAPESYEGPIVTPVDAQVMILPESEPLTFDDVVVIFPADSGMPPIYIMYASRRHQPGVVTGTGATIDDNWLLAASTSGAPIPAQVAEKLRGRRYSSFDSLRRAIWSSIAASADLRSHFTIIQLRNMKNGNSPLTLITERVGGRIRHDLHHLHPIALGGAVYDLDNLVIMTPRAHIKLHKTEKELNYEG